MTSYRNGLTAGVGGRNPNPVKRGQIKGWTHAAVRRHTAWLYSINAPELTGEGYSFTLTMRDTPVDSAAFGRMRDAWIQHVRSSGAIRWHWIVEWQRRGTPHVHAAIYYPADGLSQGQVLQAVMMGWFTSFASASPGVRGQNWDLIWGAEGWLKYLSKHAARGVDHYQRSGKPKGWETTGRLWGKGGEWPSDQPMKFNMDMKTYWRLRRLVRGWRISDAQRRPLSDKPGAPARAQVVHSARQMLACPDPKLSAVRGVSDWVPEDVHLAFIALLVSQGHAITQRSEVDDTDDTEGNRSEA